MEIREDNFPLNMSNKEITKHLKNLIDIIENINFPNTRPKYFILERNLSLEGNYTKNKNKKI